MRAEAPGGHRTSTAAQLSHFTQSPTASSPAPQALPLRAPRGRLLRPRRWAGLAAAAAIVVGLLWFHCIPPFECPLLQAMEEASTAPAEGTGKLRGRACETVDSDWACGCLVLRTKVPVGGGEATLLLCPMDDHRPSFRRRRDIDGERWWVAYEHGRTIVAFEDPDAAGLWCFVGETDEATLLAAAKGFRAELPRTSK